MTLHRKSAVIGSAIAAPIERSDRSLEELLYEVSQTALHDAGLTIDDIDGIVVGSNDQFDGRAISIMAASAPLGGVDRDIFSTPSAGEHAFVLGVLRIATGQFETQLVVSWSPTEASSLSEAQRLGADPYYHRQLPLDELSTFALQASALGDKHPAVHGLVSEIVRRNRDNGAHAYPGVVAPIEDESAIDASKPLRWPIREGMLSPPSTGIVAVVLASEDYVDAKGIVNPAWINGMGWATEPGFLGDRDLTASPALREAAKRAYEEVGIDNPRTAFDAIELTGATPYQELLVYNALGLSPPESWTQDVSSGVFDRGGSLPVNPSGGVSSINPVFCTGLIRIAEAAAQVRGKAGRHQLDGAKTALAHAGSGFAMMYQTVIVLGSEREGGRA